MIWGSGFNISFSFLTLPNKTYACKIWMLWTLFVKFFFYLNIFSLPKGTNHYKWRPCPYNGVILWDYFQNLWALVCIFLVELLGVNLLFLFVTSVNQIGLWQGLEFDNNFWKSYINIRIHYPQELNSIYLNRKIPA